VTSRRVQRVIGRRSGPPLLVLEEAEKRLRPFNRRYLGIRSIPLRQVVGTDGRAGDFDRDFEPRRRRSRARLRSVGAAFPDGAFPPIVVSRLGDAYFVVDGHHRVALARRLGMETIDAEVTELRARWRLRPDADADELIHAEQHRIFMEESGLAAAAPRAGIRFSAATGYAELLENVQLHGYRLMRARGEVLAPDQVAGDWYERV
jgi:ParB-like nuclease domain